MQTLDLMQISHENESEHDIDIEVVGVGLASEDWDFRSFSAGTGPNPADPAEVFCSTDGSLGSGKRRVAGGIGMWWRVVNSGDKVVIKTRSTFPPVLLSSAGEAEADQSVLFSLCWPGRSAFFL